MPVLRKGLLESASKTFSTIGRPSSDDSGQLMGRAAWIWKCKVMLPRASEWAEKRGCPSNRHCALNPFACQESFYFIPRPSTLPVLLPSVAYSLCNATTSHTSNFNHVYQGRHQRFRPHWSHRLPQCVSSFAMLVEKPRKLTALQYRAPRDQHRRCQRPLH